MKNSKTSIKDMKNTKEKKSTIKKEKVEQQIYGRISNEEFRRWEKASYKIYFDQ